MKGLHITEHNVLSRSNNDCVKDRDYKPDIKMMQLITKKIGCNLPWSRLPGGLMKNCSNESDYNKYLKAIFQYQKEILDIPKKCTFDTWTISHLEDYFEEKNETSILLDLMATEGQVHTSLSMKTYHFKIQWRTFSFLLLG